MQRRFLEVALPGAAAPVAIGYAEFHGSPGGPRLTVLAGVHGTEYTSIAAAREFLGLVDESALRGDLVIAPVVNVTAFWARSPFVVPEDGKNLNRSFPGDPDGTAAEVLADALTRTFIAPTDYLLDLHAGDLPEALEPFVLYDESDVADRSRELAGVYGLGHVIRQTRAHRTVGGSTSTAAADLGKPAIIAEAGQNGVLDRPSVQRHLSGLAGVCAHLGMLAGAPATDPPAPVEHEGWHWLYTPVAGWWQPVIEVGTWVPRGELLGAVSDLFGESRYEVRAPEDGTALFLTSSPAVLADGLLLGLARDA